MATSPACGVGEAQRFTGNSWWCYTFCLPHQWWHDIAHCDKRPSLQTALRTRYHDDILGDERRCLLSGVSEVPPHQILRSEGIMHLTSGHPHPYGRVGRTAGWVQSSDHRESYPQAHASKLLIWKSGENDINFHEVRWYLRENNPHVPCEGHAGGKALWKRLSRMKTPQWSHIQRCIKITWKMIPCCTYFSGAIGRTTPYWRGKIWREGGRGFTGNGVLVDLNGNTSIESKPLFTEAFVPARCFYLY